jgi:hypothetical protein
METRRKHTKLSAKAYQALVRSELDVAPSPWALDHVQYHSSGGTRRLELSFPDLDAPSLVVPVNNIRELASATVKELRELHLSPARDTIISNTLDVHISVEGLIRDFQQSAIFNRLVSTLWAAQGGRSTSEKKRLSSAENGKKGGRPPKASTSAPSSLKKERDAALA